MLRLLTRRLLPAVGTASLLLLASAQLLLLTAAPLQAKDDELLQR